MLGLLARLALCSVSGVLLARAEHARTAFVLANAAHDQPPARVGYFAELGRAQNTGSVKTE
jgi:hypothetical protein